MKIVVNVQSQTQSSRGLVHYIAHSKIDASREQPGSRELFNDHTDSMSVRDANFSLKIGVSSNRPQNKDLHHLVVSVRPEDYRNLGANEQERIKSLRDISREAMRGLEKLTGIESLDWAAAVHRNTDNPHVHIAISKRFISPQLDEHQRLTKLPKQALPHYESQGGKKVFVPGVLIETATRKMDEIIERNLAKERSLPEQKLHTVEGIEKTPERSRTHEELRNKRSLTHEGHIR
jgi:hypothetical protein